MSDRGKSIDLPALLDESYKKQGAAHLRGRDAYKDVPILKPPPWKADIEAYFFFGGISAGAAILGSLADVFGGKERQRLAHTAHYVSFVTLLPCPILLIDDLGVPARFHHMLRIFKPSSPMNLGAWALLVHSGGATITVMRMFASEGNLPFLSGLLKLLPERLLAGLGLPSALALAGYTGVLLGTTSIPVWYTSPLLGALFMSSALSTGAAATSLVALATERENRDEAEALATLGVVLGSAELAGLMGYVVSSGEAARPFFKGKSRTLLLGSALAIALGVLLDAGTVTSKRGGRSARLLASVATLAGGALLRWAIVNAGKESARDREGTLRAMRPSKKSPGWGTG